MADESAQHENGETSGDARASGRPKPSWREVWQVPLLLIGVAGLGVGIFRVATNVPKPDVSGPLARAEAMISDYRSDEALALLNEKVFPAVDTGAVGREQRRAYHMLAARAIYLGQRQLGISIDDNNESVAREYLAAENLGEKLDARDGYFLADTLVSLGRVDEARARADRLAESDPGKRRLLYRRMIEVAIDEGPTGRDRAAGMLASMLSDATLPPEDRSWATARQAEALLAAGYAEDVIARLLRTLPRLAGTEGREVAELHLLLGRAYMQTGEEAEAARSLARAGQMLAAGDELRGELLGMEAEIDAREGRTQEAREKYVEIVETFSGSRTYLRALLGIGESEALLGRFEESLAGYRLLAGAMESGERSALVERGEVIDSLLRQHRVLMAGTPARGGEPDPRTAIAFAELAEALAPEGKAPPEVYGALASSHRAIAAEMLPERGESPDPAMEIAAMEPGARDEARGHLRRAGRYANLHASSVSDDAVAYANSIWDAADAFDLAGDRDEAVAALLEFTESFPSDGRHAEGRFRLGTAYQARGEYEQGAEVFRAIIADRSLRDVGVRVGPYADASYVPLAQCLLLDGKDENDGEAETLLLSVVDGSITGTRAGVYRDALVELAGLFERTGRWARAIERYTEALERYPEDARVALWRFRLADSCRRDAERIRTVLRGAMPDADRVELEGTLRDRLTIAMGAYEEAVAGIEKKDARKRRALEALYLRNSMFYLGDCAYDLGRFDEAIRRYEQARERYPNDPASLVAMVQIVNAYVERGDWERARTANQRARRFYESLPESVWDDPNLPMTKRDWERWLEASARLYALEQARASGED